jgi:cell wall-associated NlpC family hydrolase
VHNYDQQPLAKIMSRFGIVVVIALLTACASTPEESGLAPVVNYALSLQGAPYNYGKATPEEGFDCSGFVQHIYLKHGVALPRTVQELLITVTAVSKDEIRPGDLLFFSNNDKSISHVGIYVDGDKFIHAPSQRAGKVKLSSLYNSYWQQHFVCAGRP